MFEFDETIEQSAVIKVIGVGGGGGDRDVRRTNQHAVLRRRHYAYEWRLRRDHFQRDAAVVIHKVIISAVHRDLVGCSRPGCEGDLGRGWIERRIARQGSQIGNRRTGVDPQQWEAVLTPSR